jgi:hypothetical protein
MLDTYSDNYNETQADAVATLMYHCGASVEMTYDETGSSAFLSMCCKALRKKFGYGDAHYYSRSFVEQQEWIDIIYSSLSTNCPVIYGGQDAKNGGHAFILDGYDEDGLVSVNWGWNGDADGFFDITLLNPGRYSFNNLHDMVIPGKPDSPECKSSSWALGDTLKISKLNSWSILLTCNGFFNLDPIPFTGEIGLIAESSEKQIEIFSDNLEKTVDYGRGFSLTDIELDISEIPEGEYLIYLACKATGDLKWQRMRSHEEVPNTCILQKTSNDFKLIGNEPTETLISPIVKVKDSHEFHIYDLKGRHLDYSFDDLPKGIYIIDGKKVVK